MYEYNAISECMKIEIHELHRLICFCWMSRSAFWVSGFVFRMCGLVFCIRRRMDRWIDRRTVELTGRWMGGQSGKQKGGRTNERADATNEQTDGQTGELTYGPDKRADEQPHRQADGRTSRQTDGFVLYEYAIYIFCT